MTRPPIAPGQALDPLRFWFLESRDRGYTAGAEVEWAVIENKLNVIFDYTFSRTFTEFKFNADESLGVLGLPDTTSDLHSIGVRTNYTLTDSVVLGLGYRFESYRSDDFALDGIDEGDVPRLLVLGNHSPHYNAHLIGASLGIYF